MYYLLFKNFLMNSKQLLANIVKLQDNFNKGKTINVLFTDIQAKFVPKIFKYQGLLKTCQNMAEASKILNLNQIVSVQKKEVFGDVVQEINDHLYSEGNDLNKLQYFEKHTFSMFDDKSLAIQDPEATYIILGIEAHVCVYQTCLFLSQKGKNVIALSDGISSMNVGDRNIALKNLMSMGVYVTTSQSLLFLLLQDANHPKFKQLLPIFKRMSQGNELNDIARF
jgi:nicotinamidase-related amidase